MIAVKRTKIEVNGKLESDIISIVYTDSNVFLARTIPLSISEVDALIEDLMKHSSKANSS